MKKLLFLFIAVAFSFSINAQSLIVQGTITNQSGANVPNVPLFIADSLGNYFNFIATDANGFYSDTVTTNTTQGFLVVATQDCNGYLQQVVPYSPAQNVYTVNFTNFCDSTTGGGGGSCYADFIWYPDSLNPSTINFLSNVTGTGPFTYYWDFGDGSTGTLANPTHTYPPVAFPIPFTVILTVTDANGCTSVFTSVVTPTNGGGGGGGSGSCTASFLYSSNPVASNVISFTAFASGVGPYGYYWDFGDGNTSTQANPVHTYPPFILTPPTATLTVTDSSGCVAIYSDIIIYGNSGGGGTGFGCNAFYFGFPTPNSLTYTFFSLSQANPNATTSWSFDNGTTWTATGDSVSYTFPSQGIYDVCVQVSDSGCTSIYCQPILVDTLGNPGGGGNWGSCWSDYTFTTSGLSASFTSNVGGGTAPYLYSWDFGDGNTSTAVNPTHTYAQPGTYIVVLTTVDANGCTTYYCLFVTVGTLQSCFANLAITNINNLTVDFQASASGVAPYSYSWSVDGGATFVSGGPTFNFTFPANGVYDVCVFVMTADSCTLTECTQISLGQQPILINVMGFAQIGNNLVGDNEGVAYLIKYDSIAGTLTAVDSMNIMGGAFYFSSNTSGDYLVKVALLPNSPDYANYLPTYLGDELFWYNSTPVNLNPNNFGIPLFINMIAGVNAGGPGFIGGLVSQGANFGGGISAGNEGEGDPVPNVSVILVDANGNPVAHTVTDANGQYSFSGIPYGTYYIHVEMVGVTATPHVITINATEPSHSTANFTYEEGMGAIVLSIENPIVEVEGFKVYPNPTSNNLTIELDLKSTTELQLSIANVFGQQLMQQSQSFGSGTQYVSFDVERLPSGTYFMNIIADGKVVTQRFVKR